MPTAETPVNDAELELERARDVPMRPPSAVESLPSRLAALAAAARSAARACDAAAEVAVPRRRDDGSVLDAFRRAQRDWPPGSAPTEVELLEILAGCKNAAAALHLAAGRCERAHRAVERALEAPPGG